MDANKARHLLPGTIVKSGQQLGTLRRFHFVDGEAGWLIDWAQDGLKFVRLYHFDYIEIYTPSSETPLGEQIEGD